MARDDHRPGAGPDALDRAALSPTPPDGAAPPERWWGNPVGELRWQVELARLLVDPVYHGAGVPRGDGAPVVTVPGFLAGDPSLAVLRGWLRRVGYAPTASGIAVNVDCSDRTLDRLERHVGAMLERTGRPVALIGHSRGGHFAKALAHRHPDWVSAVVSLGAGLDDPFAISVPTRAAVAALREVYARTSDRVARNGCLTDTCRCRFARDYSEPFPPTVPLTSVYSRGDGVVRWRACVTPYAHCVEVGGSHVGLAFNRKAYRAIAEALAGATAPA